MNWLIYLTPVVAVGIMIIVIMRVFASMSTEQDKKRKEDDPFNSIGLVLGVGVGLSILMILMGIIVSGRVGVNYTSFGQVAISGKASLFPSFSYVILAIVVISAIYLFRRDIFKKRSVRIG